MSDHQNLKKTSFGLKVAYSLGQTTDSVPFNLFFIYFLFFFTDIAGLNPAIGGTISLAIILVNAFTDPVVGYLADRTNSKYGRRRPYMLAASFPLFIFIVLLFTTVDFGPTATYLYYLVIGILFWTSYTVFVVPFAALGAELTQDFNDRNNIRTVAGFFIYLTVWAVTVLPMVIWDRVAIAGGSDQSAWFMSAVVLGALGLICGLTSWNFTRGKELATGSDVVESAKTHGDYGFFNNYKELIKERPLRNLIIAMVFFCVSFAVASAALVFLMSNNLGLSETSQALYWTCFSVMTFIVIPISNLLANTLGKKNALILLNLATIGGCLFYFFTGIDSFIELIIFSFIFQLGNTSLWILGFSLGYDCVEVDEFLYGYRREGAITSFISFAQKLGSAFGMWVSGVLLTFIEYDGQAEVQTAEVEHGILLLNTVVPAIAIAIAVSFLFLYPINSKSYHALLEATKLKKAGKEFSTEEFKKLI